MRRRTKRGLTAVAVLAALPLLLMLMLETGRTDPGRVAQSHWYRIGTRSRAHRFDPIPQLHPVAIEPVPSTIAGMWAGYLRVWVVRPAAERGGGFDPATGVITILGRQARLEAELALPWRPTLTRTLRHEYGHAMLHDWLYALTDDASAEVLYAGAGTPFPNPDAFPAPLRPVIHEYRAARRDVYGAAYFTSTFDEYLAESYSRYLGGQSVGDEAERFLAAIEERGTAVR